MKFVEQFKIKSKEICNNLVAESVRTESLIIFVKKVSFSVFSVFLKRH